MAINYKTASLKDLEQLVKVEQSCFNPNKYHLSSKANFHHMLTKGNTEILICQINKQICGMSVIFYRNTSSYGRLYSIAVLPEYQGKDIGKKLFQKTIESIKKRKLKGMLLEIRTDNIKHKERYLKLGFKEMKKLKNYYPDNTEAIKLKLEF